MGKKKKAQQVADPVHFRQLLASDLQAAERLMSSNPSLLNAAAYGSESALHFWAVENRPDLVSWLLARGADPNVATESGSPLFDAATVGHVEVCQLLVEAGRMSAFETSLERRLFIVPRPMGAWPFADFSSRPGRILKATENCGETPLDQALPRKREAIRELWRLISDQECRYRRRRWSSNKATERATVAFRESTGERWEW